MVFNWIKIKLKIIFNILGWPNSQGPPYRGQYPPQGAPQPWTGQRPQGPPAPTQPTGQQWDPRYMPPGQQPQYQANQQVFI